MKDIRILGNYHTRNQAATVVDIYPRKEGIFLGVKWDKSWLKPSRVDVVAYPIAAFEELTGCPLPGTLVRWIKEDIRLGDVAEVMGVMFPGQEKLESLSVRWVSTSGMEGVFNGFYGQYSRANFEEIPAKEEEIAICTK